jgi:hypothetical protein
MKNLGFKSLEGIRVLLELPPKKKSVIALTPELEKEQNQEWARTLDKLTIYAVGKGVSDFKKGDVVLVTTEDLRRGTFHTINGQEMIMVNSMAIALVW